MKEVIRETAEILKCHGWVQNSYGNKHGHCLFGALSRAAINLNVDPFPSWRAIYNRIGSLAEWNDKPERTKEDVLQLLRTIEEEV